MDTKNGEKVGNLKQKISCAMYTLTEYRDCQVTRETIHSKHMKLKKGAEGMKRMKEPKKWKYREM